MPRPDLQDTPLQDPELIMFVDGSCSKTETGLNKAGYAVVTLTKVIKAEPFPSTHSAQLAEIVALTEACKIGQGKRVNIYTDSQYAFSTIHTFAQQWKNRGMINSSGKPVKHRDYLLALLDAVLLPSTVAVCKCAAHQPTSKQDDVSRGNRKADIEAKKAAMRRTELNSLTTDSLNLDHKILRDMQNAADKSEKRKWEDNDCTKNDDAIWTDTSGKPVLPKSLFRFAAQLSHGLSHVSTGGMVSLVNQTFKTFGFTTYAKRHCENCHICMKYNPQGNMTIPQQHFPHSNFPFQFLHLDFIELSPCMGKKWCLMIIDSFSRWVEAFPSAKADGLTVAKALVKDIIPRFGVPSRLYSDNGSHFVNEIIDHLTKTLCIDCKRHCSYHPQSAELVERSNGTIKNKLRKTMSETGRNWVEYLPLVLLNMRMLPSAKAISPYECLFGKPFQCPPFSEFGKKYHRGGRNVGKLYEENVD